MHYQTATWTILVNLLCHARSMSNQNCFVRGHAPGNNANCVIDKALPEGVKYEKDKGDANMTGTITIIGDLNDVFQGVVTRDAERRFWTGATSGVVGIGAGTLGPINAIGELMVLNGTAYVRSTDIGTANYFKTEAGAKFRTQYSTFITNGAKRNGEVAVNFREPSNLTAEGFYSEVYEAIGRKPFCFYGLTQFAQLDAIAISKAPIYGEPFLNSTDSYYSQPNYELVNALGVMMGCVANFDDIDDPIFAQKLKKVLYSNPLDTEATAAKFSSHTHALTLNQCLGSVEEVKVGMVEGVYHMLSNATIRAAKINVFVMNGVESLVEL